MPKITYVLADGTRRDVDAAAGTSIMEAAIRNNVKGIEAECGGCLSCATCHVYVDADWFAKLPEPETDESEMLEFVAAARESTSRLSCQLVMQGSLDGIIVRIPPKQS
jgi:2Fe-2S ferredoxin